MFYYSRFLVIALLGICPCGAAVLEEIEIDSVWAANKVSFDLHTVGNRQFVAYYDKDRMMTVASREIGSTLWAKKTLSSKLAWDSHNYVTMGIDEAGHLHVSGNMHVDSLVYYRSEKPYDVSSLKEVHRMVGEDEDRVTYPKFFNDRRGGLFFSYRSGSAGNGNVLINRYLPKQGKWERYLATPLFEGIEAEANRAAYHSFTRDSEGNYHFVWIWRWTPEAETSHQICYAVSPDLLHWKNAAGETVELPFRPDDPRVIVDPVPSKGGAINGRVTVVLTRKNEPIVSYIKYDEEGLTQLYLAKPVDGKWITRKISDWDFRWKFIGGGDKMSRGGTFNFRGISERGLMVFDWDTETGKSGRYVIDPVTLEQVAEEVQFKPSYPPAARQRMSRTPGLSVNLEGGRGAATEDGIFYALKWETMPKSHGKHAPAVIPEGPVSKLMLLKIQR